MLGLAITLLIGFFLRLTGLNWDQGMHLHPDERMLIMVSDKIHFFTNLNPNFFNYGSLPIYLLSGLNQIVNSLFPTTLSSYDSMLYIGRALSLLADMLVIFTVNKLSWKLFKNRQISILAPLLYALSFFPIQNSHFFIVDTFLNLFLLLTLYAILRFVERESRTRVALIAFFFAAALTIKITAVIFIPFIGAVILFQKRKSLGNGAVTLVIFTIELLLFSFILMPFAFLDWQKFIADVSLQIKLASDPYVFPYTLQYVGTIPYIYYVKNIFLWGLGPVTSVLSIIGCIAIILELKSKYLKRKLKTQHLLLLVFLAFYAFYFVSLGRSAVKFMRYMLPLYPFLSILAAYGLMKLSIIWKKGVIIVFVVAAFLWTLTFSSMFTKEHTRISASNWILKNIPTNSVIAVEHWDDRLPIYHSEQYRFEELQLYNQPDNKAKWEILNRQLERTDYMVIASNRLYVPLQKLDNCAQYKACYPITSQYYKKLLGGQSNFKLIKEFVVQPELRILKWSLQISDQSADESFTVYDHPKILIFQNVSKDKSGL
ncbi:MAG: glycosyltransferase family 39 protein [Microgenomates group bacterium]